MNITVYTMCYNAERILPFFLDHYSKFATEIIIYDNESTDKTVSIASKHPLVTKINTINTDNTVNDQILIDFKNTCWKDSTSNYVIVVDVDELLYHPNIINFLKENRNFLIFKPCGYDMISETFPNNNSSIISQIKKGNRNGRFDKSCIFNPKLIKDINYKHGAHECNPSYINSKIKNPYYYSEDYSCELKLLHYRYLGLDNFLQKNTQSGKRLSKLNHINKWGIEYTYDTKVHVADFKAKLNNCHFII